MADDTRFLTDKIRALEEARDKISHEWLREERERTRLVSAIDNLAVGFMMLDDYSNVIRANQAVDRILGSCKEGEWTIDLIQKGIGKTYDLISEIKRCFHEKVQIGPKRVNFGNKVICLYISPIVTIKESVAASGVTLIIEKV